MTADSEPLEALGSRYLLIEKLSEGGMGSVYKVKDTILDKDVALKVMKGDRWSDKQLLRFQREAKTAGRLRHHGIGEVYDFGIDSSESPYMILELIPGQDLKTILSQRDLTTAEVIEIGIQVAGALDHAHRNDLIHRDIKPANIMIAGEDRGFAVKIIDFGVARLVDEREKDQGLTTTNALVGSPAYMSPEQARELPVDHRCDLYSLGCVLFEALAGRPPFEAESTMDLIKMHAELAPPAIQEFIPDEPLAHDLQAILRRLLAKAPDDRFESAADLKKTLEHLQSYESPVEESANEPQTPPSVPARSRVAVLVTAIVAITVSSCAVLAINSKLSRREPDRRDPVKTFEMLSGAPETVDQVFQGNNVQINANNARQQIESGKHRRLKVGHLGMSPGAWKKLPGLGARELHFENCNLTRAQRATISQCQSLKTLKIKSCRALDNDENLEFLKDMTRLKSLDLSENGFTGEGLRFVTGLPALEQINLHNCPNLTPSGLKHLASCPSLIVFELKESALSKETLAAALSLPRLQVLELSHSSFDPGLGHLFTESACARTLKSLSLKGTRVSDADLEEVLKLPALKTLDVQDCAALSQQELERFQGKHHLPAFKHGQSNVFLIE
ncbi:MAG: protein kinase [Candidatus Obscuribacterales bacterium]